MVISLVGYFLYVVAAFTATMVLLIRLSDNSMLERVLHYPRPIIVETVTASKSEELRQPISPGTRDAQFAKDAIATDVKSSRIVGVAKADHEKNKPRKLAHLDVLKALERQRENNQGRRYTLALSYAEASGYRPGLDGQR